MRTENNTYYKEKQHVLSHLWFILLISFVSFIIIRMTEQSHHPYFYLLQILLGILVFYSVMHYVFILFFPEVLEKTRKLVLILVDLIVLTLSIIIIGSSGLFLLPLYILIVMENGVNFGFVYFYFSMISSSLSWVILVMYSSYWERHSDTVAVFAITTFLIPLVFLKQMMEMHQKHDTLHEKLKNSKQDAHIDSLTSLPNRKKYNSYMKKLLAKNEFFALLFIDLNKFKMINDTYGHHVGDEVLIEIAKRLSVSIDEEDMLARLGGDEFVIITKRKKVFLEKFLEKLEKTTIGQHQIGKVSVYMELSIGISLFPNDSKSEIFLRKYADEAMYVAKKRPDSYHVFYEELSASEDSF
jgi:diguanylate cyclase (GGDEF)-like protein